MVQTFHIKYEWLTSEHAFGYKVFFYMINVTLTQGEIKYKENGQCITLEDTYFYVFNRVK